MDGIIVMYSGTDSPYKIEAEGTARLIQRAYTMMKERGIDIRRLRLAAICTVCVKPFLKEVNQMNDLLKSIGLVRDEIAARAGTTTGKDAAHG
jgi:coenzyme F420-reducing hydrogenase delta subunit